MAGGVVSALLGLTVLIVPEWSTSRGDTIYMLLGAVAVIGGVGATIYYLYNALIRHREAERHLRLTQEQFRALASNVPGVIFQWSERADGHFGFNYCSPRCEELFGFKAENALDDWSVINIHPGDAARWAESIRDSASTLKDWFFEGRLITPNGQIKWWRGIAKPIRASDSEVLFNGILLDITDAKEAEREIREARRNAEKLGAEILLVNQSLNETNGELRRLNQQKNEFLGIAAHDLKNPLGGIVGFAGAIRVALQEADFDQSSDELLDMTDSIEQSARHMLHIINELLNTSVLESQGLRLDSAPCDLALLARSVTGLNEHSARQKGIRLFFDGTPGCEVLCDAQKVQDLIDNLISNAIKYSAQGSRVWVNVRPGGTSYTVLISVKDEGPGLTDEDKKRLFGKFQKLSARPTGGEVSTGLGLSIAKSIVDLHGGRIWAESEVGKGSTFNVELPIEQDTSRERDHSFLLGQSEGI